MSNQVAFGDTKFRLAFDLLRFVFDFLIGLSGFRFLILSVS